MNLPELLHAFTDHFNAESEIVVRAPGRVNLIGEHTDYNAGFVLPIAIDHAVWMVLGPRADSLVRVFSRDLGEEARFDLQSLARGSGWAEYIKGVAHEIQAAGMRLKGFDALVSGDIPRGAGLSSSAALELASARAFAAIAGLEWDALHYARLAQAAENNWVGVQCGIMDQMASAAAQAGHALFLDCRSLEIEHIPIPSGVSIVVLDASTRRGLVDSVYNQRRMQCEQAARWFDVPALRDVSIDEFEKKIKRAGDLPPEVLRRARHVISENARVLEAIAAMRAGDLPRLGALFNASHESLRRDFEVSSPALDIMVECARAQSGCYGARMTGAGFGGCAVALVSDDHTEKFAEDVAAAYLEKCGLRAAIYQTRASEGASIVANT